MSESSGVGPPLENISHRHHLSIITPSNLTDLQFTTNSSNTNKYKTRTVHLVPF